MVDTLVATLVLALLGAFASPASSVVVRQGITERQTTVSDLPAGWRFLGCFKDSVTARTLSGASLSDASSMTIESCVNLCVSKGFAYAGLEFGHECFCDNAFNDIFPLPVDNSQCTLPCAGNTNQICGAADRLSIYFSGVLPRFPAPATPPTGWTSLGCFSDSPTSRLLPHEIFFSAVTVETCLPACLQNGFSVAGVEFGKECWCGSGLHSNATVVGDKVITRLAPGPPFRVGGPGCDMGCAGNSAELCGGTGLIDVFQHL